MESLHASDLTKTGFDTSFLTYPQEKPLKIKDERKSLIIGVPKETHNQEMRVALTPSAVGVLVANGHQVVVEHNAGINAEFSDQDYSNKGAVIAYTQEEVYHRATILTKINPLESDELHLLQPNQVLFSAVHLGNVKPDYLKLLIQKNISAIGFEFLQANDGSFPIMRSMSEIAGITSIHIAAELLSRHTGGKGLLLGGITGIPPAVVTIIGAGAVGYNACKTAYGLGATVKVIDEEIHQLKMLEEIMGRKIYTVVSQQDYIEEAVISADVVIGATYKGGHRSPCVVTEDMVAKMKDGSVIIDVAIDQGGCVETSRITTHENPTFIKHGVVHYCVPNIASRVSRTASIAISNILSPILLKIGESGGVQNLIGRDPSFKTGLYVYQRHITQRSLANMFNMDFMDIDLLYSANIYS